MEDKRETAANMLIQLTCKNCLKELTCKLAPEGKHWNMPLYTVDKCSCLSDEEEITIEEMKDNFERAIEAIIKHEDPKSMAEALLEEFKKWRKIPRTAFTKIPKMVKKES
jgi:hypothetical protein